MRTKTALVAGGLAAALLAVLVFDPGQYLNLAYLKAQQQELHLYVQANPLRASLICFAIYTAATGLSIPGAFVMTLAAGAVFGTLWGTVIVSFASTLGATFAFLMSRYLFHGFIQSRFGHRLQTINRGIRRDGPIYLLTLRLIPVVPFIGVNVLMALTPLTTARFYIYSQIGMLPATIIYVNAGTQLATIESVRDIASPAILISLGLLAVFPFVAKAIVAVIRRRRFISAFPPPVAVDRNVIVIGAGSGGLVASLIAATVRARVTLVEQGAMGGDCLNTGCVPSKALLRAARQAHAATRNAEFGISNHEPAVDFAAVMGHVREAIRAIEPHDSVERYTGLGVECINGRARVISPYEVEVDGKRLSARAIVLATGAKPLVPALPGLESVPYLTSDTVWDLTACPRRLVVLGGGPIGCELAQAFARLGSQVTLVEMSPRLLPREDVDVSALIEQALSDDGVDVRTNVRATGVARAAADTIVSCAPAAGGDEIKLECDELLLALGRTPNTSGYGLDELGVTLAENGAVETNEYLQTSIPTIYACGDVVGPYQFTHVASHQAWYASVNALFGRFWRFAVDYRVIPWCTFTDPEVAHVGVNIEEATARGLRFEQTRYDLADLDRAIAERSRRGFVRVLTAAGSDRILGVTIVGENAGEMIAEFVLAMKHHLGLNKILGTIHIYPTYAEANKFAASTWRKQRVSARLLDWLQRYHQRQRDRAG